MRDMQKVRGSLWMGGDKARQLGLGGMLGSRGACFSGKKTYLRPEAPLISKVSAFSAAHARKRAASASGG